MVDAHRHDFAELVVRLIRATNPAYQGTTSDRAFVMRRCTCGAEYAFDYGATPAMKLKARELRDAETDQVTEAVL
jgi:hypothetical protein